MIENPKIQLPEYISHKRVRAAEILGIADSAADPNQRRVILNGFGKVMMPVAAFARYEPKIGDFLVEYEDGYRSFSPRKAFVEGYTLACEESVLMEQLRTLGEDGIAKFCSDPQWVINLKRLGRHAYVTINSLKHQLETIERAKANDLQAGRQGGDDAVASAAGMHPAAGAGTGDGPKG